MIGQRVGPYELVELIASGGMGSVFRAVRVEAEFEQQVAIKLVRPGMNSREVLHRFLRERQTLARLHHPNIARLLDGGAAADGSPYLVMEYVEGTPITRYCDDGRLTIDQRLALFVKVCAAVQHAHRNLIVHRDLKPSNILVTSSTDDRRGEAIDAASGTGRMPEGEARRPAGDVQPGGGDGAGEPMLLDFGISKLLDDTSDASMTVTALRFLTPRYASPEQVLGEPITTSSDVYALGVILYELLCGRPPYDLAGRTTEQVRRLVCEADPARPSDVVARERVSSIPEDVWWTEAVALEVSLAAPKQS
ncbi:MAG: serine/threonine protein kinase, partial [Phycisphaerales bacterium]